MHHQEASYAWRISPGCATHKKPLGGARMRHPQGITSTAPSPSCTQYPFDPLLSSGALAATVLAVDAGASPRHRSTSPSTPEHSPLDARALAPRRYSGGTGRSTPPESLAATRV